jgi:uncharacterized protein (DUF1501 family)
LISKEIFETPEKLSQRVQGNTCNSLASFSESLTMTDRRDFLKTSSLLGFGARVPTFLGNTALAAPRADQAGAKDTILVVVQLTGGNDGLNTVIPIKDELYAKYRPSIGIKKADARKLDDDYAFHPAMEGLAKHFTDGLASVIHGVGYPNPSQSHFRSMDIWHAASTQDSLTEGWLGKALKQKPLPAFHLAAGNEAAPLALTGAAARVPSIATLADFQLKTGGSTSAEKSTQKKVIEATAMPAGNSSSAPNMLDFVRRTATTTYAGSDRIQALAKNYEPKATYPATGLANRLKIAAQLIDAGIGARIFYVSMDGFDTHSGQGAATGSHANLLGELSGAVSAFYDDLEARGHGKRVCVMTFSEFGRRAKENGSQGTDHGSGAPMILVGGKLKPGFHGTHPSLAKLDEGNLVHTTDFRRVYAAMLKTWLGLDAKAILGQEFAPLDLFA